MVTKRTSKGISIHTQQNPECIVTDSVSVFTYASRLPVSRQPAGVLVAVGYMRYLALMPPPIVSITNRIRPFTSLWRFCLVHSFVTLLHEFSAMIQVALMSISYPARTAFICS